MTPEEIQSMSDRLTNNIINFTAQSYKGDILQIQMKFKDPLLVSKESWAYDQLTVLVLDQTFFKDENDRFLKTNKMTKSIPK